VDIGDGDLVRRARTGDAAAFRLLVERHQAAARARAARWCAHPDDVDDVVQEAFLQAFTGQIAGSPGAAKASLHKPRRRLREHITAHRPDLIPAVPRRITMTTVRIAHAEPHFDPRLDGTTAAKRVLVVLADDPGRRAMGLWLPARHGMALWRILDRPPGDGEPLPPKRHPPPRDLPVREFTPEDLASRLLAAAGATVTGVNIDERGPDVLAAQIAVASPAGHRQVTAPPGTGLALAAALELPVRVADALMDRLAIPVTGDDLLGPFANRMPAPRPEARYGPRHLTFADSLSEWVLGGSSQAEVTGAHWDDHTVAAADGAATLSAAVPQPYGDVFLGQSWMAGDYRGATMTLRAELSAEDVTGHPELSLFVVTKTEELGPDRAVPAAFGPRRVRVRLAPGFQPDHHRQQRLDQIRDHRPGPR